MIWNSFERNKEKLATEYTSNNFNTGSGLNCYDLEKECDKLFESLQNFPKPIIRAEILKFILENGQIEINPYGIFADKIDCLHHIEVSWYPNILYCEGIMRKYRNKWMHDAEDKYMKELSDKAKTANEVCWFQASTDFGHTCPDWESIMRLGISGLLARIRNERNSKIIDGSLTEEQDVFYRSCEITYDAVIKFMLRLADEASDLYDGNNNMDELSECLKNLAVRKPENLYEAMELTVLYYHLQDMIEGENVRSLGALDRLYYPFYVSALETKTYNKEQIKELFKYFLYKMWAKKVPNDVPFCLGGIDEDGFDATNELSFLIMETFKEMNIYSPKIHIRYHNGMNDEFLRLVMDSIRQGNSSIVVISEEKTIESLMYSGAEELEARNNVPIGCYEPSVAGLEVPCTGNAKINIVKCIELALNNGTDPVSGKIIGKKTGDIAAFNSFEMFFDAVKKQLKYAADLTMATVSEYEHRYNEINPAPLFSGTIPYCIINGRDAYSSGDKYNNSSVSWVGLASAVDALAAVKSIVFDKKILTLRELNSILISNWKGNEKLNLVIKNRCPKFGNGDRAADRITCEITEYISELITNQPNGRGGIFKAGLYSIDACFKFGEKTGASADGRRYGEPLSKNLCASTAMDKNGVTALINSVTEVDFKKFNNGSVLDIVLHPSAVMGMDGMEAMLGIFKTYFRNGGYAVQANILDHETLIDAQQHPEKYSQLQVRLCGWNVYFVNLSAKEQNEFIKQASER